MRIIKIGCNNFTLPDGVNIDELLYQLENLSKGSLETDYSYEHSDVIYIKRKPYEIELKVVEDRLVFDERPAVKPEPAPIMPADEDIGQTVAIPNLDL